MKNCIIYLIGFIGVGKLTTAKEIVKQDDSFRLFDNHAANNVIFSLVRDGENPLPKGTWGYIHRVCDVMFDAMTDLVAPDNNYVLTNALFQDDPEDLDVYRRVEAMAQKRGAHFLPVRLLCDEFTNKARIVDPARAALMKKTSVDGVEEWHKGQVLIPDHPHTMTLDISQGTPAENARKILAQAQLICA